MTLLDFETNQKANGILWGEVKGVQKRHYNTDRKKKNNWKALESMVDGDMLQVLQDTGSSAMYTSNMSGFNRIQLSVAIIRPHS